MSTKQEIVAELEEMGSSLAGMPRTMPYAIPECYFAKLEAEVINKIKYQNEHLQYSLPPQAKTPYVVPQGYFESATDNFVSAALHADTNDAQKNTPYSVPENYFESLPDLILSKVATKPAAPKISNRWLSYLKWSIAAMLVIGAALTCYTSYYTPAAVRHETILANAADSEITEYMLHIEKDDAETVVGNSTITALPINNTEIVEYLNETGWD